ncbi:WD40/YVTN/BNR-like repeat-containing protein [Hymenobacter metallilatus]|uniref:Exo-alpha-sialidase n=1 Tax=Hymenobacter metallilatus TaxID=2493666 RepID=A0A428JIQ8_9BACT|nr:hypothetical protein [Hymenobacter metallilatus]RSK32541.1 hypothetical protein EI290_12495 [Hymenobacter metallilatus]
MNKLLGITWGLLAACTARQENELPQLPEPAKTPLIFKKLSGRENDAAVNDLLSIGKDTLIAVKHGGGLALTIDAGGHWQHLHDEEHTVDFVDFNSLTIDQQGVLWGLDRWAGMHEADYARLALSPDLGKTWLWHDFNPETFFPYSFYSQPGQPLQIVTNGGTVYQLQDQIGSSWRPKQYLSELDNTVNDTTSDDSYFAQHQFKFLKAGQLFRRTHTSWELVGITTFINEVEDVCACNGRIYFTSRGSAYGDSPDYLLTANGPYQPADTLRLQRKLDQVRLRCDGRGRLWLFNYRGIWQKVGSTFQQRY